MKAEVSNKITMFNFIMTLAIVLYHFWFGYGGGYEVIQHWTHFSLVGFNRFCIVLGSLAMCTFFLLSGFLLYNNANNSRDIFKKMKNRVFSLVIPFLIWTTFMMIYQVIAYDLNPFASLKTFLVGYSYSPFNGPLWYIFALIIFMLIAPLIIKLKNHKKTSLCVLICVILSTSILSIWGGNFKWYQALVKEVWIVGNIVYYLPLYAIGAFAGLRYSDKLVKEDYNTKLSKMISIPVFIFSLLLLCIFKLPISRLLFVICCISLWFSFDSKIFSKKPSSVFNVSFFMYAMHAPFLMDITYNIFSNFYKSRGWIYPIEAVTYRILGTLVIWGITILLAYIFKFVFSDKVFSALSGNRAKIKNPNLEKQK